MVFSRTLFFVTDETRIEIIWKVGKRISPINYNDKNFLNNLPFVLFSSTPIEEILPDSIRSKIDIKHIGVFDENMKKSNHKSYTIDKKKYVAIINHKISSE